MDKPKNYLVPLWLLSGSFATFTVASALPNVTAAEVKHFSLSIFLTITSNIFIFLLSRKAWALAKNECDCDAVEATIKNPYRRLTALFGVLDSELGAPGQKFKERVFQHIYIISLLGWIVAALVRNAFSFGIVTIVHGYSILLLSSLVFIKFNRKINHGKVGWFTV